MKRLISGVEAAQLGLSPGFMGVPIFGGRPALAAVDPVRDMDAFRLWRSRDGYRKACRMLRRSGRRLRWVRTLRKLAPNLTAMSAMDSLLERGDGPDYALEPLVRGPLFSENVTVERNGRFYEEHAFWEAPCRT